MKRLIIILFLLPAELIAQDGDIEEMIKNQEDDVELAIKLDQNSPNPFGSLTEIQYFLSRTAKADLSLYNMNGMEVAKLINKYIKGGWHTLIVNGSGLSDGIYILRLTAGGRAVTRNINKMD